MVFRGSVRYSLLALVRSVIRLCASSNSFFEDTCEADDEECAYISAKYRKIVEKLDTIDSMLNEKAENWDTARMGKVDLTILRLAVYEITFDEEIPTGVAINEAVELAKKFGQDASSGFINGILAKFA